jgi:hypothetical protein
MGLMVDFFARAKTNFPTYAKCYSSDEATASIVADSINVHSPLHPNRLSHLRGRILATVRWLYVFAFFVPAYLCMRIVSCERIMTRNRDPVRICLSNSK